MYIIQLFNDKIQHVLWLLSRPYLVIAAIYYGHNRTIESLLNFVSLVLKVNFRQVSNDCT